MKRSSSAVPRLGRSVLAATILYYLTHCLTRNYVSGHSARLSGPPARIDNPFDNQKNGPSKGDEKAFELLEKAHLVGIGDESVEFVADPKNLDGDRFGLRLQAIRPGTQYLKSSASTLDSGCRGGGIKRSRVHTEPAAGERLQGGMTAEVDEEVGPVHVPVAVRPVGRKPLRGDLAHHRFPRDPQG
jgi:hypothetical protein